MDLHPLKWKAIYEYDSLINIIKHSVQPFALIILLYWSMNLNLILLSKAMDLRPFLNKFSLEGLQEKLIDMIIQQNHPLAIIFFNSTKCRQISDRHFQRTWSVLIVNSTLLPKINLVKWIALLSDILEKTKKNGVKYDETLELTPMIYRREYPTDLCWFSLSF